MLVHFHEQLCINFKLFYLFFIQLHYFFQEDGRKILKTESWQKKVQYERLSYIKLHKLIKEFLVLWLEISMLLIRVTSNLNLKKSTNELQSPLHTPGMSFKSNSMLKNTYLGDRLAFF